MQFWFKDGISPVAVESLPGDILKGTVCSDTDNELFVGHILLL